MSSLSTLRDELTCSICHWIYSEPVTLRCGHSFCRSCLQQALDTQGPSRISNCPYCRKCFKTKPSPQPNTALCNLVKRLQASAATSSGDLCTYCITAPVPAVMSCLLCEASLCNDHIAVHNKSPEHVLVSPPASPQNSKCIFHRQVLVHFNPEDAACVCCAPHRGHQSQEQAGPSRSLNRKDMLEKLTLKREKMASQIQDLLLHSRKVQKTADTYTINTRNVFAKLNKNLSTLKMHILQEIQRQEERISNSIFQIVNQLEIRESDVTKQIACFKETRNVLVQGTRSGDEDEGTSEEEEEFHVDSFIPILISETLRKDLCDIMTNIQPLYAGTEAIDLLLDADTVDVGITVSEDQKTATWYQRKRKCSRIQESPGLYQVLSTQRFSPGKYYWEVESSESMIWRIGVTYPGIDMEEPMSRIGDNEKSWSLCCFRDKYSVRHANKKITLSKKKSAQRIGVYLNSEAGTLSFYELGGSIQQLYTFTNAFSESLQAALYSGENGCMRIR